jgi:uncharacterized protein YbjT (DUF2867 family)
MRAILFGATGMVGQGVLRECVLDPDVDAVLAIVRRASTGSLRVAGGKVRELVTDNFYDFSAAESEFAGYDACFFCLGVSSFGMTETEYRRVTYDLTMVAARAVLQANPDAMTFVYVSGAGTNAQARSMWARVKGETENALLAMPFKAAYMLRPGVIVPLHGIKSKTAVYRVSYAVLTPLLPVLLRAFPKQITTTEQLGRAMLRVAKHGYPKRVLKPMDIAAIG